MGLMQPKRTWWRNIDLYSVELKIVHDPREIRIETEYYASALHEATWLHAKGATEAPYVDPGALMHLIEAVPA